MSTDGQIPGQLHIPTAPHGPVSMTRQQVTEALQGSDASHEHIDCHADKCFSEPVEATRRNPA